MINTVLKPLLSARERFSQAVVPIFVFKALSNRYEDLMLLIPRLLKILKSPIAKKINIFE